MTRTKRWCGINELEDSTLRNYEAPVVPGRRNCHRSINSGTVSSVLSLRPQRERNARRATSASRPSSFESKCLRPCSPPKIHRASVMMACMKGCLGGQADQRLSALPLRLSRADLFKLGIQHATAKSERVRCQGMVIIIRTSDVVSVNGCDAISTRVPVCCLVGMSSNMLSGGYHRDYRQPTVPNSQNYLAHHSLSTWKSRLYTI